MKVLVSPTSYFKGINLSIMVGFLVMVLLNVLDLAALGKYYSTHEELT
jgi:hypothetical protein